MELFPYYFFVCTNETCYSKNTIYRYSCFLRYLLSVRPGYCSSAFPRINTARFKSALSRA